MHSTLNYNNVHISASILLHSLDGQTKSNKICLAASWRLVRVVIRWDVAWYGMVWHGVPRSLAWHCVSIKVFSCTNGSTLINMLQNTLLLFVIPRAPSYMFLHMYTCMCLWVSHCHLWGIARHPEKNIFWKVQTCRLKTETELANHRSPSYYILALLVVSLSWAKSASFSFFATSQVQGICMHAFSALDYSSQLSQKIVCHKSGIYAAASNYFLNFFFLQHLFCNSPQITRERPK